MSTGGEEVGKISIRVVPELDRFRAELLKELQFWEKKTLKIKVEAVGVQKVREEIQAAAKDAKADIKTDASNVAQTRQKIKAGVEGITSTVKVEVDQATLLDRFERRIANSAERAVANYEPKLSLTVDDEILRRSIEDRLATLKGLAALPVHVDPEIATRDKLFLEAEFQKILTTLQAHADADKIKIKFDADAINANEQMQRALSKMRLDKFRKETKDTVDAILKIADGRAVNQVVKLELDRKQADIEMAFWRAQQANNAISVKTKIKPDADMGAFARVKYGIEALFGNIRVRIRESKWTAADLLPASLAKGLETAAEGLTKVGTSAGASIPSLFSFAGMVMVVVAAVAVLLPPLLALAAGFITLVPALGAILVPIGAVMLGLGGIKKAAENAGLFKDANGAKKGGGAVGAALDEIKQKVSDTFEGGLTRAFEQLPRLFTAIKEPMVGVAQGLTDMTTGFINAITSTKGMENVRNIIAKVGEGLSAAAPGVRDFTDGLLTLISGISNKFPGLGKWFSDLGATFSKNMENFTKPGADGMSRLDTLIANVRKGIEGLTGIFQSFWNSGMQNIQDPSFGQHMLDFFNHVRDFVTVTLPQLANGFESFAAILNNIVKPFETMGAVMDKIEKIPGFGLIKDAMSLISPGSAAAMNMYPTLQDFILQDPEKAKAAGKQAGVDFAAGLAAGAQIGANDGTAFTDAINNQLDNIVGASKEQQIAALKSVFQGDTVTNAVKDQITGQMSAVVMEIENQMAGLAPAMQGVVDSAIVPITTMPQRVAEAFASIPAAVTGAFALIAMNIGAQAGNVTAAVAQAFTGIPQAVGTGLAGLVGAITTAFGPAKQEVQQAATDMSNILGNSNGLATAGASTMFAGVPGAIASQMQVAVGTVTTMCQLMVNTALSFAGAMEQSGAAIGASFAKGMASQIGLVSSTASSLLEAARAFFPNSPAQEGPFSGSGWVDKSGEAVAQGFADGIDSGMSKVVSIARELMQAIKDVFGSADGLTLNFNFGGAMSQMDGLVGSSKQLTTGLNNVNKAGIKPAKIDAQTQAQLDGLKQQNAAIDVQVAQLRQQKFGTDKAGKAALDAQIAELNARKANITAQLKQMEYDAKYSDQAQQTDLWNGMNQKITDGITSVGQGVMNAYTSDLGISGNGALQGLMQYGMDLGNKFIFNVANMDDALMAKDREVNKQSLSYAP